MLSVGLTHLHSPLMLSCVNEEQSPVIKAQLQNQSGGQAAAHCHAYMITQIYTNKLFTL